MLEVHGVLDDAPESRAATALMQSLSEHLPGIENSPDIFVHVFVGLQLYGCRVKDIDLLVIYADYREPDERSKVSVHGEEVSIHSFFAVIETKSHQPESVRFDGASCIVRYKDRESSASRQAESQLYSVKEWLGRNGGINCLVTSLIWLTEFPESKLPSVDHNILGAGATWIDFLEKCALMAHRAERTVQAFTSKGKLSRVVNVLGEKLEITPLDRIKFEEITKNILDRQRYVEKLGQQLLIFRGLGGTGKTVNLLRIGFHAYRRLGLRVAFLTYNKALVADVRRQLAVMRIHASAGESAMRVSSIYSFMHAWMTALGVFDPRSGDFLENYDSYKRETLALLQSSVITSADIDLAYSKSSGDLHYDLLLVDEGQDWPEDERALLFTLYGHKNIVVADGIDQHYRSRGGIDWRAGVPRNEVQVISLPRSLRQKSALCGAVRRFASYLDVPGWTDLAPVPENHGGRIIFVHGNLMERNLHARLRQMVLDSGNRPIDILFCVHPWVVPKEAHSGAAPDAQQNAFADSYCGWGYDVWDGTVEAEKDIPPTADQVRFVQYRSCRGLEGWLVVCHALDYYLMRESESEERSGTRSDDLLVDDMEAVRLAAMRKIMIPLTRAIDTLVIHIEADIDPLFSICQRFYADNRDICEWIENPWELNTQ